MKNRSNLSDFYYLRFGLAGLRSPDQAARWLGISRRTLRRWDHGEIAAPRSAWLALRLLAGDLGAFDSAWSGWYLRQGGLWPPERGRSVPITAGQVASLPYLLQLQAEVTRPAVRPGSLMSG